MSTPKFNPLTHRNKYYIKSMRFSDRIFTTIKISIFRGWAFVDVKSFSGRATASIKYG